MLKDLLTPNHFSVLRYVALGYSNKQIAAKLFVSESTIKVRLKEILLRLKVKNRLQAAVIAANFLDIPQKDVFDAVEEIRTEKGIYSDI